jgi:polar amino acid transport system substrate-binding protein
MPALTHSCLVNLRTTLWAVSLWTMLVAPATAACSRDIVVPVSNIGQVVMVEGLVISGVYPDVLRELGSKAGCVFRFVEYPRARSDVMFFEYGTSDLVIPASFLAERAQVATFVPLIKVLPTLVTTKPLTENLTSVKQLLQSTTLRGAVVRSFNFGSEYQTLIAELIKAGRIDLVPDINTVARMLVGGRVGFTIAPAHLMHAALGSDVFDAGTAAQMRSYPLEGLPRVDSGVYISRRSLGVEDHDELLNMFSRAAKADIFIKGHQKYYAPEVLQGIVTRP